jgi:DMSO/TMAO reductase YedYZ molybdopterin-dependent catalytic subunit
MSGLLELGRQHGVKFLKAMQCNNIPLPLGQGLWEGVPLRDLLRACGKLNNVRRVYYWGFHNNDPKQLFQSSLAINQVLDTPPGELPPFVAYRLNGLPIPLERGGPVRMVIPWAHGFKSIKWLEQIVLTNDYQANDTYALENNDPESYLKTAAYLDDPQPRNFRQGRPVVFQGTAMVGWPGLARVEGWLRTESGTHGVLDDDDPAWKTAVWRRCRIDPPPSDWGGGLPNDIKPSQVWGFGSDGRPREWPMRFSVAHWSMSFPDLKPGGYEFRVRTVDQNGFAQPEPRPGNLFSLKTGLNSVQCKQFIVM